MADNKIVTELIVQISNMLSVEQLTKAMRDAGMSVKQTQQALDKITNASKTNAETTENVAKTFVKIGNNAKKAATDIDALNKSINAPKVGPVSSFASALGKDSLTRDFAKYQTEISKINSSMMKEQQAGVLSEDRQIGFNARLARTREIYKEIGAEIARLAGISPTRHTSDITGTEYAAVLSAARQVQMQREEVVPGSNNYSKTIKQLNEVDEAQRKLGKSTFFNNNQMLQFTASVRNTAESLASGMSVSTTAMTQGMQLVGAFVGENLKLMALLGVASLAVVVPLVRAMKLASESRDINTTSAAYNDYATSLELAASAAHKMADASIFSRTEVFKANKELLKTRELSFETRQGIMSIVTDFATGTGQELDNAVKELNNAFNSGYEGIRKLNEVYGFLNNEQLTLIRNMMESGNVVGAQRIAMAELSNQMKTASHLTKTMGKDSFIEMAAAWNKALDDMANSDSMKTITHFLTNIAKNISTSIKVYTPEESRDLAKERLDTANIERDRFLYENPKKIKPSQYVEGDSNRVDLYVSADFANIEEERYNALVDLVQKEALLIAHKEKLRRDEKLAKEASDSTLREADKQRATELKMNAEREINIIKESNFMKREALRIEKEAIEKFKAKNEPIKDSKERKAFIESENLKIEAAQKVAIEGVRLQIDAERDLTNAAKISARAMLEARANAVYKEGLTKGGPELAATERNKVLVEAEQQALRALHEEQRKGAEELTLINKIGDARGQSLRDIIIEHMINNNILKTDKDRKTAKEAINATLDDQIGKMQRISDIESEINQKLINLQGAKFDNLTDVERRYQEARIAAEGKHDVTIGKGDDPKVMLNAEKQLTTDLTKAEQDRTRAIIERERQVREMNDPLIQYKRELAAIKELNITEDERRIMRIQAERDYETAIIRRLDMEEDWSSGAERGWNRYIQSVGSAATQTEELMGRSLRGIEDMFVDFVTKNEFNFKKFADSFIEQLIRMEFRLQMSSIHKDMGGFKGIASSVSGWFGNSDSSSNSGGFGFGFDQLFSAHGNAFNDNSNVVPFAHGGTFTNSIVSQPTQFRFARGVGLMGEAGPEAIVPLTRTPTGDLGVRSTGGGGVTVEVYDQRSGNTAPINVETQMGAFGPIIRIIARDEATKVIDKFTNDGGLSNQLRNNFNIRQPAIARG